MGAVESFYEDVLRPSPAFTSPRRCADLALLEPETREKIQAVVEGARARGVALMVYETFRSRERQQLLYDRGASRLREVGVHHYGLACDLVRDVGGDPSWKGSFALLGELGRLHGLVWGGDWGRPGRKPKLFDPVHLQRISVARQKELFRGTWYPGEDYDPFRENG